MTALLERAEKDYNRRLSMSNLRGESSSPVLRCDDEVPRGYDDKIVEVLLQDAMENLNDWVRDLALRTGSAWELVAMAPPSPQ